MSNLALALLKRGTFGEPGLVWSDLWKNRLVKQKLEVVVVVICMQLITFCIITVFGTVTGFSM